MTQALTRFGFRCTSPAPMTGADLGNAVFAEIDACGPEDLLVVAVVGHGELSRTADLHVVGLDGTTPRETRVVDWVKEVENRPDGPRVLFFVDICYAGEVARSAFQLRLPSPARATVFAACAPRSAAFDGRFTQASAQVLDEMGQGLRHVPPEQEHIPLTTLHVDIRDRLDALIVEEDASPQDMLSNLVEFRTAIEVPPFFANPDFDRRRAEVLELGADPAIGGILAEVDAVDPLHFITRAAGHDRPGRTGCFTGRATRLSELARWLDGVRPGDLRLVTGSPGTGKSALLGVLACAAYPELRRRTERIWTRVDHRPAANQRLAIAHARQRGAAEIFGALATQFRLPAPDGGWTGRSFGAALAASPHRATVLVDALDEAVRRAELAADLAGLVERGECRVLVGTRRLPDLDPLHRIAAATGGLVDLDDEERDQVHDNIRRYVEAVLELTAPYDEIGHVPARRAFAEAVADVLGAETSPAEDRWGEFLVAAICTHRFASRATPVADEAEARALGAGTPRTLPAVMELDLESKPRSRAVLTALGHALGDGMPVEVVRSLAPLFGPPMTDAEVRTAMAEAGFYLRQTAEADGTTLLYRLFHHGLTDHLRNPGREPDVLTALSPADWSAAPAYVRRHLVQHAAPAGRLPELLDQAEFLVHTDPVTTLPQLATLRDAPKAAHVYRASAHRHATAGEEARRQILAVDAARFGSPRLVRRLLGGRPWAPAWATGATVSPALRMTLPVGGRRHVMGTVRLAGRLVLAVSRDGGPFGLWDLETGRPAEPGEGLGDKVTALDGGRDGIVVTGHQDGTIRAWDVGSVTLGLPLMAGHAAPVTGLARTEVGGTPVLVSAGADGAALVWDLTTGTRLGEPLTRALDEQNSVACATANGPVTVTTDGSGTAQLWSLRSGRSLGILRVPGVRFRGVSCAPPGDRAVLWTDDGRVWTWNLTSGEDKELAPSYAWPGTVTTACSRDGVLIAGGDRNGSVRCADLARGHTIWSTAAHGAPVSAITMDEIGGGLVIISAGEDGRICLWNSDVVAAGTVTDQEPITGLAAVAGTLGVLTGRSLRLHDPRTGTPWGEEHRVGPGTRLTAHPDGSRLISYAQGGPVSLWQRTGKTEQTGTSMTAPPRTLAGGQVAGRNVLACGSRSTGLIEIVELDEPRRLTSLSAGTGPVTDLEVHTVGNRSCLIVIDDDGGTLIVDLVSDNPVPQRLSGVHDVRAARGVRVGGRHVVVTGTASGEVRGWDLRSGAPVGAAPERHDGAVTAIECVDFGEGPMAITGSDDATVAFWDLSIWRRTGTFALPEAVQRLAIVPDTGVAIAMRGDLVVLRSLSSRSGRRS